MHLEEVGGFRLVNDTTALLDVWHADEVPALKADKSNFDEVALAKGFHIWRWTIGAPTAELVPSAASNGLLDLTASFSVDGRLFGTSLTEDPKTLTNETFEILPSGEVRPALKGTGQVMGIVRIR